ncbi:CLUMA_CG003334, isoform A [Clunio marinus]|uniref:CLUMA_CG003334, isoform A n=1 Tax=Clunio marinus TaxID=568069 RepID=A0A1J1HPW0_9DIPT|nr:CLUMA_CG003334, isoform A [Clunio marinus]
MDIMNTLRYNEIQNVPCSYLDKATLNLMEQDTSMEENKVDKYSYTFISPPTSLKAAHSRVHRNLALRSSLWFVHMLCGMIHFLFIIISYPLAEHSGSYGRKFIMY